ncbi:hypothetical protein FB595_1253 [Sphingobium sp. AEW010]|nr:hypothetical protein FB595_1253 [Sphingobium sp. AEW010]TWD18390.1 hypothetical protein FB596_1263 [Sphingobium sp. AEW013]TWD21018.1 hypothetical protein FB594_1263 [Sphingobium sp. AEW001]
MGETRGKRFGFPSQLGVIHDFPDEAPLGSLVCLYGLASERESKRTGLPDEAGEYPCSP